MTLRFQRMRSLCLTAIPAAVLAVSVLVASGQPVAAQQAGKLEATYTASLGGIPVGRGNWLVDVNGNRYSATVRGGTVGLLRIFASGEGNGSVRGSFGAASSAIYASLLKTEKKTDSVKLLVNNGVVKDAAVEPPIEPDDERVPITDVHRRGVADPLSASILRVPGTAAALGPEACHTTAVFDGRTRYDLQLSYKRMDHVRSDKGYEGPVVVCAVYFKPIAGFILSRTAVKYLMQQRDMEVWLAPMAGTRVVVPYRVSIPTPIGLAVLEANDFVSTVQAASNEKTQ